MKILLVHLSDIHLKDSDNIIIQRIQLISESFQNMTLEVDKIFLIITGDIAFSGKENEYSQAIELIESIKENIKKYSDKEISVIMIPGNHDCYFEKRNKTREILISSVKKNEEEAIDDGVIEQCCEVQKSFFGFFDLYKENEKYSDKLLSIFEYKFSDSKVVFNCYNTSWISQPKEQYGKIYFPKKIYDKEFYTKEADLTISIFHHPCNWLSNKSIRDFKLHINVTSDIVLTGHEHIASKSLIDDLEGNYTEYIEGAVLQDSEDEKNSGFNIILFDLEKQKQKILNYKWNGSYYSTDNGEEWISYKRYKYFGKREFEINSSFEEILNDIGVNFMHPRKQNIVLDDFFVWPYFRNIKTEKTQKKDILNDIVDSRTIFDINSSENNVLIVGQEKSGKSFLCKKLYKFYYNKGFVPILIDGRTIKSSTYEYFKSILNKSYCNQYSVESLEKFSQLENKRKFLIIDNFDKSKLNIKHKYKILKVISEYYPNIIITGNELYPIEEIICDEEREQNIFEKYQQFEIQQFGHFLRDKVINKWNLLGQEEYIDISNLIRNNDIAKQIIDTIIGKNYVPSYPIFILTILQTIEAGSPHKLDESAYGYYYEYLIIQSLSNLKLKTNEIDAYHSYITELAYIFFENESYVITKDKLSDFHKWFCQEYSVNINFEKIIKNLQKAFILDEKQSNYMFKYKYILLFCVKIFC